MTYQINGKPLVFEQKTILLAELQSVSVVRMDNRNSIFEVFIIYQGKNCNNVIHSYSKGFHQHLPRKILKLDLVLEFNFELILFETQSSY